MKTKSIWGEPPSRLYRLMRIAQTTLPKEYNVCIVGCSDGKFLLPFARAGHFVTGYDVDTIDLYGGMKDFPIRDSDIIPDYSEDFISPSYSLETREILGVCKRVQLENLDSLVKIEERDFYKNTPNIEFDLVFTSCSLHYTLNNGFTLAEKTKKLQSIVKHGGLLYMDYMMALNEADFKKYPDYKFYRNGEAASFFDESWQILSCYEQKKPVFEAAHVVTTYDHFHRFGFLLSRRIG